ELVVGPADGCVPHSTELPLEVRRLLPQRLQGLVLHPILALHLPHQQLGIRHDLELVDAQLRGLRHSCDQPSIFRHVIRRSADRLAARVKHCAVLRLQHVAIRGRPRIAARAAVRRQLRLHTSAYTSNAGSSYGCALRNASMTSSSRSGGTTVSRRNSGTRSSHPASPIVGFVDLPPRNVPVPSVYHQQRV